MKGMKGISDELLLLRFARGDVESFRIIVGRYTLPLLAFCRGFATNEDEAEDLVQETFYKVIRNASGYESSSRFSSWLFTIARNVGLERIRVDSNRLRLRSRHRNDIEDLTMGHIQPDGDDVSDQFPPGSLEAAFRQLPLLEAQTLRLTYYADLSTLEIAQIQECASSTVRVRRHNALRKLRKMLTPQDESGASLQDRGWMNEESQR